MVAIWNYSYNGKKTNRKGKGYGIFRGKVKYLKIFMEWSIFDTLSCTFGFANLKHVKQQ